MTMLDQIEMYEGYASWRTPMTDPDASPTRHWTIFPDGDTTTLHCGICAGIYGPERYLIVLGYHPSLDRANELAAKHDRDNHNDRR